MSNAYDNTKWGVHFCGPDTILAAESFEHAVKKAEEINKMVIDFFKPMAESEYSPIFFAQVDVWSELSKGEHDPSESDWDDIC